MARNLVASLPESAIRLNQDAHSWEEAVRIAGDALVASGATTPAYGQEMVDAVKTHGPYIVIVPHIALAHSRPGPSVLDDGLSWVSLKTPVEFGHPQNDPVRVVIGLASMNHDAHIATMAALAALLGDVQRREEILAVKSVGNLKTLLAAYA
ncbi:MAG TPA: PTS transporter subunit EIIA [Pseudoclavibacter sp.]|nr:PTS transporter subunit EIIA [Pseudoclavibacter sp.]